MLHRNWYQFVGINEPLRRRKAKRFSLCTLCNLPMCLCHHIQDIPFVRLRLSSLDRRLATFLTRKRCDPIIGLYGPVLSAEARIAVFQHGPPVWIMAYVVRV